jgi:hypothetical protein
MAHQPSEFLIKLHEELKWGHKNRGSHWMYFNGDMNDPKQYRMCEVVVDSMFPEVAVATRCFGEITPNGMLAQLRNYNFEELSDERDRLKRFYYHDEVTNQRFRLECDPATLAANPRHYVPVAVQEQAPPPPPPAAASVVAAPPPAASQAPAPKRSRTIRYEPYDYLKEEAVGSDSDKEDEDYVEEQQSEEEQEASSSDEETASIEEEELETEDEEDDDEDTEEEEDEEEEDEEDVVPVRKPRARSTFTKTSYGPTTSYEDDGGTDVVSGTSTHMDSDDDEEKSVPASKATAKPLKFTASKTVSFAEPIATAFVGPAISTTPALAPPVPTQAPEPKPIQAPEPKPTQATEPKLEQVSTGTILLRTITRMPAPGAGLASATMHVYMREGLDLLTDADLLKFCIDVKLTMIERQLPLDTLLTNS